MTVSYLNNETHEPNETIANQVYNRLCHSLVTLESALRQISNNASRIGPPNRTQQRAIHGYLFAISTELHDALDEMKHHADQRKIPKTAQQRNQLDKALRDLNLE